MSGSVAGAGGEGVLWVDPAGRVAVDGEGQAVWAGMPGRARQVVRVDSAGRWAARVEPTDVETLARRIGGRVAGPREFAADRPVTRAIALLRHRDLVRFDPLDGTELTFDPDGVVARGTGSTRIYPRVDPAVIGLIELAGTDRMLLARNARRSTFWSLIAGYVDPGENLEEAFVREAWEETGRRIHTVRYWGSQPWAASGSLMVGFTAVTGDASAIAPTDGELEEVRWVGRDELDELPLARPGSIAHAMITEWRNSR